MIKILSKQINDDNSIDMSMEVELFGIKTLVDDIHLVDKQAANKYYCSTVKAMLRNNIEKFFHKCPETGPFRKEFDWMLMGDCDHNTLSEMVKNHKDEFIRLSESSDELKSMREKLINFCC